MANCTLIKIMATFSTVFSKDLVVAFLLLAILTACPSSKDSQVSTQSKGLKDLISRGKLVYSTNCASCHNPDPKKAGNIGPEIYGSTRELIEARVILGSYPPGYAPKRPTKIMTALPNLKNDIDALAAFLNN